jgi:sterol desaturase/sphingolipid hydroxylase (fatty acid hydroxylase superfamily)
VLRQYWFWLFCASLFVLALERVRPWRAQQKMLRPLLAQDFFWLVFNGYVWSIVAAFVLGVLPAGGNATVRQVLGGFARGISAVGTLPLLVQAILYLVAADFIEWCVHNALHRVGWLWPIHRVHHSIHTMDWIGSFRFHWGEHIVYRSIKFVPLALLGARYDAMLIAWVTSTAIGHLNHANLKISWGPFRYVLNSPMMHIWHHDRDPDNGVGYNFGIVFSMWDWIFRTAYMPAGKVPGALGFHGDERYPDSLWKRFLIPYVSTRSGDNEQNHQGEPRA